MRLGRSLEGEIIRIDTTRPQTTLLLGDPGIGKTTLCRYVVRWWLARTAEHVVVSAARRAEWADLSECSRLSLHDLWAEPARSLLEARVLVTPGGRVLRGFDAYRWLLPRLPALSWSWPFWFIPGVAWVGRRIARGRCEGSDALSARPVSARN